MQNAIERLAAFCGVSEKGFDGIPVCQFPFDKLHTGRQKIPPAMAQIIKYNGFMPRFGEQAGYGTTYIPRPSCDQYLHKKTVLPQALWFTLSLLQQGWSGEAARPPGQ
jgi:hypothetical protein